MVTDSDQFIDRFTGAWIIAWDCFFPSGSHQPEEQIRKLADPCKGNWSPLYRLAGINCRGHRNQFRGDERHLWTGGGHCSPAGHSLLERLAAAD